MDAIGILILVGVALVAILILPVVVYHYWQQRAIRMEACNARLEATTALAVASLKDMKQSLREEAARCDRLVDRITRMQQLGFQVVEQMSPEEGEDRTWSARDADRARMEARGQPGPYS